MPRATLSVLLLGILAVFTTSPAAAQGPPINTDTPITLGFDGRGARVFTKVIRQSGPGQTLTVTAWPVMIPLNMTTDWTVGVVSSLLSLRMDTPQGTLTSSGLGDFTLFTKYVALRVDRPRETFQVAVKGGLKLPTGDETAVLPLGSGAVDYSAGAVLAWIIDRSGVYAEVVPTFTTEAHNVKKGNSVSYNVAWGYRLLPGVYGTYPARSLNAYLEVNGAWRAHDRVRGHRVPDSGGQTLFLSPGLQYIPWRRVLVEASVQVPVVEDLNGSPLKTDVTVMTGFRVLLF